MYFCCVIYKRIIMLECVYSVLTESRIPIDEYLYKYVDKANTLF